jgi:selenocysteine-specific elongation factor
MKGSGVVVTGTLANGYLSAGDDVIISPSGLPAHIRTVESYKQQAGRAQPGSRVALNLSGIKRDEIKRGDIVLISEKLNRTSRIIDVEIRLIPNSESLKNNAELIIYLETRELLGRITLFNPQAIQSQEPIFAQIRLNQDVAAYVGEHFILRQQSPARTIGGGTILDPFAAKYRSRDIDKTISFLEKRRELGLEELILSEIGRRKYIDKGDLLVASCYSSAEIASSVTSLLDQGKLLATKTYIIEPEYWQEKVNKVPEILKREHSIDPSREGLPQAELHNYLALPREAFNQLIGTLVDKGRVVREDDIISLQSHKLKVYQEREVKISNVAAVFANSRNSSPPTIKELVAQIPGSEDAIRVMCQRGMLIDIANGILFDKERYDNIKDEVIKFLKKNGQISIQDMHSLFDLSRKYTIPLLNYLEREGIVRREGDIRILANKQD